MRCALLGFGLLLLGLFCGCNKDGGETTAAASATPGEWKVFSPEGEKFSIKMPGDPTPQPIHDGTNSKAWAIQAGGDNYGIRSTAVDEMIGNDLTKTENYFDVFSQTLPIEEGTEVLAEKKPISVAGVTGREIEGLTADKKYKRLRICIAGGRFYQIMATGSKGSVNSPEVEVYFDSFKVAP